MRHPLDSARRQALAAGAVTLALAGAVAWPVSTFLTRSLVVALSAGFVALLMLIAWRHRVARIAVLAMLAVAALLVLGPGRRHDGDALAGAFVRELRGYEGTRYVWGGENALGIDCSGLVRRALVKAALKRGVMTANPSLTRFALGLWWRDCTARQLGEGHDGRLVPVTEASSVNDCDASLLRPGDLAVTRTGVHVMAHAGAGTWVEADPGAGTVLVVQAPSQDVSWFGVPVRLMRWRVLQAD